MADVATIAADQQGAYELSIAAGATITVGVAPTGGASGAGVTVIVHAATSPVYARNGSTVAAKDPYSTMIPAAGAYSTVVRGAADQVAITSAAAATVSVSRG